MTDAAESHECFPVMDRRMHHDRQIPANLTFAYAAQTFDGRSMNGTVDAPHLDAAMLQLQSIGLRVTQMEPSFRRRDLKSSLAPMISSPSTTSSRTWPPLECRSSKACN